MASAPWLWTESRGSRLRGWKPGAVGQPLPGGGQRPGSTEMLCKELNQQPPSPSRPGNCTGFQEMQTNASSPGSGLCLLSASFSLQIHKIPRRWHRGDGAHQDPGTLLQGHARSQLCRTCPRDLLSPFGDSIWGSGRSTRKRGKKRPLTASCFTFLHFILLFVQLYFTERINAV